MSEGTPKPATWPMWRGPLAYGQATATRIDCGVGFGEACLQAGPDFGHLTEHLLVQRRRLPPAPRQDPQGARAQPERCQAEQPPAPAAAVDRDPATRSAGRCRRRRSSILTELERLPSRRGLGGHISASRARPPGSSPSPRRSPCVSSTRRGRSRSTDVVEVQSWSRRMHRRLLRGRGPRCPWLGPRSSDRRRGLFRVRPLRRRCTRKNRRRWLGRGHGNRGPRLPRREQGQRIEIAVRLRGQANAEMDVRLVVLGLPVRPDGADDVALPQRRADTHADRTQVQKRDRVAVLGADRHRAPRGRNRSSEADHTGCRRANLGTIGGADVHAPMLTAEVRVVLSRECTKNGSIHRPAPGSGRRCKHEPGQCADGNDNLEPVATFDNHTRTVTGRSAVVKFGYSGR
jgi:hypothetical protein